MQALLISATALALLAQGASTASQEDKLVANLLQGLKPTGNIARPVSDAKDNATVTLSVSLTRISRVKHNTAELEVWLKMVWNDPRLAWNKDHYSGLSSVALPADLLWLPDIRPYYAGYQADKEVATRVVVSSDAKVIYVLPVRLQVPGCETQRNRSVACKFSLGSWVYDGGQVDIRLPAAGGIDWDYMIKEGEWTVASAGADRETKLYPCCPEPYVSVNYRLMLDPIDRKSKKTKKSHKSKKNKKSD